MIHRVLACALLFVAFSARKTFAQDSSDPGPLTQKLYRPTSRTDSFTGAINRQRELEVFFIVLAIVGWLASKLINGPRVYRLKSWEPA